MRTIPVMRNTTDLHALIDNPRNPGDTDAVIKGKFLKWDNNNNPTRLIITKNVYPEAKIFTVESVINTECVEGENIKCNELQLKAIPGVPNSNEIYDIVNTCDLNFSKIVLLIYKEVEIRDGVHKKEICHSCYLSDGLIPEIKEGNILQG